MQHWGMANLFPCILVTTHFVLLPSVRQEEALNIALQAEIHGTCPDDKKCIAASVRPAEEATIKSVPKGYCIYLQVCLDDDGDWIVDTKVVVDTVLMIPFAIEAPVIEQDVTEFYCIGEDDASESTVRSRMGEKCRFRNNWEPFWIFNDVDNSGEAQLLEYIWVKNYDEGFRTPFNREKEKSKFGIFANEELFYTEVKFKRIAQTETFADVFALGDAIRRNDYRRVQFGERMVPSLHEDAVKFLLDGVRLVRLKDVPSYEKLTAEYREFANPPLVAKRDLAFNVVYPYAQDTCAAFVPPHSRDGDNRYVFISHSWGGAADVMWATLKKLQNYVKVVESAYICLFSNNQCFIKFGAMHKMLVMDHYKRDRADTCWQPSHDSFAGIDLFFYLDEVLKSVTAELECGASFYLLEAGSSHEAVFDISRWTWVVAELRDFIKPSCPQGCPRDNWQGVMYFNTFDPNEGRQILYAPDGPLDDAGELNTANPTTAIRALYVWFDCDNVHSKYDIANLTTVVLSETLPALKEICSAFNDHLSM